MSKRNIEEADKIFSGEKMQNLRNEKGLTRQQIFELTKIPSTTLQDWEYENYVPTKLSSLRALAEALDCSLQDFCYDGIVLDPKYKNIKNLLSDEEIEFLVIWLKNTLNTSNDAEKCDQINNIINKLS